MRLRHDIFTSRTRSRYISVLSSVAGLSVVVFHVMAGMSPHAERRATSTQTAESGLESAENLFERGRQAIDV